MTTAPERLGRRRGNGPAGLAQPRNVCASELRVATWSISTTYKRLGELDDLCADNHVVTFQEARITDEGRHAMEEHARSLGFQETYWSTTTRTGNGAQTSWIALWSKIPAKRIQLDLEQDRCQTRHVPILLWRKAAPPILFVAIYAHANDQRARRSFLTELLEKATLKGLATIVIGDWNDEPNCEALRRYLMAGLLQVPEDELRADDEAISAAGRRIDFAAASRQLTPLRHEVSTTTSDHRAVKYALKVDTSTLPKYASPRRRKLNDEINDDRKKQCEEAIADMVLTDDVDAAWGHLSNIAEDALSTTPAKHVEVPRADPWTPLRRHDGHKRAEQAQSTLTRRILRLQRRISHL